MLGYSYSLFKYKDTTVVDRDIQKWISLDVKCDDYILTHIQLVHITQCLTVMITI